MNKIEDVYGLTPAQQGIYIQSLNNRNTEAYKLNYLFELDEKTDIQVLQQAVRFLAVRHPVLRTAFAAVEGTVKQVVLTDRQPYIETIKNNFVYSEELLKKTVDEKSAYSFDLQMDSLMRCFFIVFSDKRFLFVQMHHLITDGWSTSVLFEDLYNYYHLLAENTNPESVFKQIENERSDSASFASYVNFVRALDGEKMKSYWDELIAGGEPCILPKTSEHKNKAGVSKKSITVAPELSRRIEAFSRAHHIPVNTVFECVFSLMLHKYSGMDDLIYNKVISGKSVGLPKLEHTVGPMLNTIPVRVRCSEKSTIRDYLKQIQLQSVNANEYGFLQLSDICRKNGIDPNLFDVLFVFENYSAPFADSEMPLMNLIMNKEITEYPLEVILSPIKDGYYLECIFDNSRFSKELIEAMQNSFVAIAEIIVDSDETSVLSDILQHTKEENLSFIETRSSGQKPAADAAKQFEAPLNQTEAEICKIFCELLKVERFGRNDNFYDFGGTSLQIVQLLSHPPLDALSPSDFMAEPTPAALAKILDGAGETDYNYITELYKPEGAKNAVVLFPFAGGDASAYTQLIAKAREERSEIALYFVDWFNDNEIDIITDEIRNLSEKMTLCFYSHCAGSALAMKLLDRLNEKERTVKNYIAGANIPPQKALAGLNLWKRMSDERIMKTLMGAGLPSEAGENGIAPFNPESFRKHTIICSEYLRRKTEKTNVTLTAVVSKSDPFTKNYANAKALWQKYISDVNEVVLIDTPSHYFQNSDAALLLSLFNKKF